MIESCFKHPFNILSLGFKNVSNVSRKKEVIRAFRSNLLNYDGKCAPDYSWNENANSISRNKITEICLNTYNFVSPTTLRSLDK